MSAAAVAVPPKGPGKRKTDLGSQAYGLGSSPTAGMDAVPRGRQADIEALMAGMKSKLAGAVGKANAEKEEALRAKERLERDVKEEKSKVEVLEKGLKTVPPPHANRDRDIHALAKRLGAKIEGTVGQQIKSSQQLQKELDTANQAKGELEKEKKALAKDKDKLETDLRASEDKVKTLQKEKEGLDKAKEELTGRNKELTKKVDDLGVTVESLQRDKSGLQTELADVKKEFDAAREKAKMEFEQHVDKINQLQADLKYSQEMFDAVYNLLEQSNNYLDNVASTA
ncbi:hypothetical protein QBC47DRAFT_393431 [Echria macrotheca]|uniref:Uncharacterized protein n=1 Tax=Echria macrotheca TaxID=438768 RepID=A0AAJ0F254_9PEZI|nr:hypothetical protein QBC47DRAFT_393431 [Echria macrotheca]